jgi:sarcosine oxidase
MSVSFDTIVIGLGGMGSATAYQLARRGKRVLGLERYKPAHNQGSSHGKSRIVRQAYFEHPAYVPLLLRAYELWGQIEQETGKELLTVTGGLMIGSPNSATVTSSIRSAREYGLFHEVLDAAEIRRRFSPLQPDNDTTALYEKKAGFVRPEASVSAHLQRAAQLGATLHFEEPVLSWEASHSGDGVQVTTTQGRYEAEHLVLTPGAWAPALLGLELPLVVERQVMYWFDPIGGIEPFLPHCFPIYIWEAEDGVDFYGFPAQDGPQDGVKVAFFSYMGIPCTPDTIDRVVHEEEIQRMRQYLTHRIPSLNSQCLNAATCLYTTTPDHHFIIGLHPEHAQVTLASPCSGHGYKFASVIGELLADLATDGKTRYPLDLFTPTRFLNL